MAERLESNTPSEGRGGFGRYDELFLKLVTNILTLQCNCSPFFDHFFKSELKQ